MLDIVQSFPLFSHCIVGPMRVYIYISPICNVEVLFFVNIIKLGIFSFLSSQEEIITAPCLESAMTKNSKSCMIYEKEKESQCMNPKIFWFFDAKR